MNAPDEARRPAGSPRRIALVTDTFYPAVDGATTTLKATADRLIATGHEVRFIAPGPGLATYNRSTVVRVNALRKPGGQVKEALQQWRPDLVHVTNPGRLGRKALKHARKLGIRTLVVQQDGVSEVTEEYWRAKVADRADQLVVTTPWMVDRLARIGVAARLWWPGVDARAFTPALRDPWLHGSWSHAKREPKIVVGYVGGLTQRHGVRHLAELSSVRGIRPVIIGEGAQAGWLRSRLPHARFTGALQGGDLAIALATLDILVHPGEEETCSHILREAGASAVPVVAPRAGGAADVVHHLETGLLYEPGRDGALADVVDALAADPQRALLGHHGRELAQQRCWETAVDELIAHTTSTESPLSTRQAVS
jgi:phosphatidylinositol alpha 1,6-mannosyltransferase